MPLLASLLCCSPAKTVSGAAFFGVAPAASPWREFLHVQGTVHLLSSTWSRHFREPWPSEIAAAAIVTVTVV